MANISTCFLWPEVTEMFHKLLQIKDDEVGRALPINFEFQDEFTSSNPIFTTQEFPRASTPTLRKRCFDDSSEDMYEKFCEGLNQVHTRLKVRGHQIPDSNIINGYLANRRVDPYRVVFLDSSIEQMLREVLQEVEPEVKDYPFDDPDGIWPADLSSTIFESLPDSLFSPDISIDANKVLDDAIQCSEADTQVPANLAFINSTICELSTHGDPLLDAEFPLLTSCAQKCQQQRRRGRKKVTIFRKSRNQVKETFVWQIMPSKTTGFAFTTDNRRKSFPRNLKC